LLPACEPTSVDSAAADAARADSGAGFRIVLLHKGVPCTDCEYRVTAKVYDADSPMPMPMPVAQQCFWFHDGFTYQDTGYSKVETLVMGKRPRRIDFTVEQGKLRTLLVGSDLCDSSNWRTLKPVKYEKDMSAALGSRYWHVGRDPVNQVALELDLKTGQVSDVSADERQTSRPRDRSVVELDPQSATAQAPGPAQGPMTVPTSPAPASTTPVPAPTTPAPASTTPAPASTAPAPASIPPAPDVEHTLTVPEACTKAFPGGYIAANLGVLKETIVRDPDGRAKLKPDTLTNGPAAASPDNVHWAGMIEEVAVRWIDCEPYERGRYYKISLDVTFRVQCASTVTMKTYEDVSAKSTLRYQWALRTAIFRAKDRLVKDLPALCGNGK
jgi:hypothetical protein